MRLQRYIAMCGITSRRKAENLILDRRVKLNGQVITELGVKVDVDKDRVQVDNAYIKLEKDDIYILLNKPLGYVTTVSDEMDRKTVMDLVSDISERIYPVGRLDIDTTGFLLLTNDGNLTHRLTHPSFEVKKTYLALVEGIPSCEELKKFAEGLHIEDYITSPAEVSIISKKSFESYLEISIHEGRNRQVRKMCAEIGHPVKELKRISLGEINLDELPVGKWRYLTESEIDYLKQI